MAHFELVEKLAPNAVIKVIGVGGGGGNLPTAPGVQFKFGQAHLEIPNINFDDVISTEVNWHALPSTIGSTDEIGAIRYVGQPL